MNITQIEINVKKIVKSLDKQSFIYDLLKAYNLPKSSITRLQKGNLNLSKIDSELSWKKKLFFKKEYDKDLHATVLQAAKNLKRNERFVIVTDFETLLAIDTKTEDKLDCAIKDLPKHYDFFLPWAGMEKAQYTDENPADVKAAEKMAKLFDEIKKDNPDDSPEFIHGLNIFLSRLLFCFFAEDTHIFTENQFTNAIASHTQTDGSDLHTYLDTFFEVLNTPENRRKGLPVYLNGFPFVNGGLFKENIPVPKFSRKSRAAILDSGEQGWAEINPDIFGSMFQAVIGTDQRGSLGQHYTSVPNIMKVIEPLFLDDLHEEFENAGKNEKKLNALLLRIQKLKIFDPACGSGNFLIIAYKELRILEIAIFKKITAIKGTFGSGRLGFGNEFFSHIHLSSFYGIEIDAFAGEIAKLALWLAEHQMNITFHKAFGHSNPTLPLKAAGKIVQGNACRLNWEEVCPKAEGDEVYILGNPPYLGSSMQNDEQKNDLASIFKGFKNYKNLDYIACWFKKGSDYILNTNSNVAFVSTNSICQGEQVALLWPYIFKEKLEIHFAHQSFYWSNNAKSKAAVIVIIVGLRNVNNKVKHLYFDNVKSTVGHINAYLVEGNDIFLTRRNSPISDLPSMIRGSTFTDNGNLILSLEDRQKLILENPNSKMFIRPLLGSREFIRGEKRWCLHISEANLEYAKSIDSINKRLSLVRDFRLLSKAQSTVNYALKPHIYKQYQHREQNGIIVPRVSSIRRDYIPAGFISRNDIILDSAQVIYNVEIHLLGIISSKIHIVWVKTVAGRLKSDFRYSSAVCYNHFPFPEISAKRKKEITESTLRIVKEREKHSDKTLAQLYDPDKMPEGLKEAHRQNDLVVEKCYRSKPFTSDEERLEYLFKLYEKMIAEEKKQEALLAKEKKTQKKKK